MDMEYKFYIEQEEAHEVSYLGINVNVWSLKEGSSAVYYDYLCKNPPPLNFKLSKSIPKHGI